MNQKDFLDRVLPSGIRTMAYRSGKKNQRNEDIWYHDPFEAAAEGVDRSDRIASRNKDVYFAAASFKETTVTEHGYKHISRKQSNVQSLKSLFLDIDFKQYPSPEATVAAFHDFLMKSGIAKPSIITNTGGGLHVYWVFPQAIPTEEWYALATRLAKLAEHHGLKADLACTIDRCRILRMPGTRNFKYAHTPLCEVVFEGADIDMAAMKTLLSGVDTKVVSLDARRKVPRSGIGDGFSANAEVATMFGGTSSDLTEGVTQARPCLASEVVANCPVMARVTATTFGRTCFSLCRTPKEAVSMHMS
jgi:hypothetical protein